MPRLFVAVDLPETIKQELDDLCSFGMPGVKWVKHEQFHLSLRFIGETADHMFDEISTVISKVRGNSLLLNLKGIGTFPQSKTPRVIWAGVEKNENLFQLRKKVEYQLSQIGIPSEGRKFSPHITLGRIKEKKIKGFGDYLSRYALFKTEPFEVTEFSLFSSQLSPKGAIYKKEANYQLG